MSGGEIIKSTSSEKALQQMSSETSSVLVAVRVRPFTAKEELVGCTTSVPDATTISLLDTPSLLVGIDSMAGTHVNTSGGGGGGSAASGPLGSTLSSTFNGNGGLSSIATSTSTMNTGGSGGLAGTANLAGTLTSSNSLGNTTSSSTTVSAANAAAVVEGNRHSYTFDKIFWSIAPKILPFPASTLLDVLGGDGDASRLSKGQKALLSQHSVIAKYLPCFTRAPSYDTQRHVYEFIGPRMYEAALAGFNACLFAYGQTGSGKSYSMIGPTEALTISSGGSPRNHRSHPPTRQPSYLNLNVDGDQGIMPRLAADLFRLMQEEREQDASITYSVELSFLEVYCEKVRDLLTSTGGTGGGSSSNNNNATNGSSGGGGGGGGAAATSGSSLRIRQHPSHGPYVEGLTHVKVRDAEGVLRHLVSGLRERATAGTNMNEHSSRSHAMLQLHITKLMADTDEATGSVVTRTRTCKVNMVDLAGSERVSQSGVSGDRFEEAKNINLSLSTLGRVIQQLSEKQLGKNVIPAYRESILTWLLADSLGGNSKTIMLATVSPSAYCYQQSLNTLRFAGVAKRVVNVATVNEDRRFEQLIAELRQQIVRLTLQLESGKAAEVHVEKINTLRREKEALQEENDKLHAKALATADVSVVQALRKRVGELETENKQLCHDNTQLQQRLLTNTTALREEVAQQRAELIQLHETLSKKEAEVTDWAMRYRALVIQSTSPSVAATRPNAADASASVGSSSASAAAPSSALTTALQKALEETTRFKTKLAKASQDAAEAKRQRQEAVDASKSMNTAMEDFKLRYEESQRQMDLMQERLESTTTLLESTRCELTAIKSHHSNETAKVRAVESALQASSSANASHAAELEQIRRAYLGEKQRNVDLLLRLSTVEQERGALKRQTVERDGELAETELMLLEETETSERYYLRMRFHRHQTELHHQLMAQAMYIRGMEGRRSRYASGSTGISSHSTKLSTPLETPHVGDDGPNFFEVVTPPHGHLAGGKSSTGTPEVVLNLMQAQLKYECQCEESQARSTILQDCLTEVARLLVQKARLRQIAASAMTQQLTEAQDRLSSVEEELSFFKEKFRSQEAEYSDELAMHREEAAALQVSEMEGLRLQRKIAALQEVNTELEGARNSLIAKVAQLQETNATLEARCAEAMQTAAEVQDLLFPMSPSNEGGNERSSGSGSGAAAAHLEGAILANKAKELQEIIRTRDALQRESEEYREAMGALTAQVEQLQAEKCDLQHELARHAESLKKTEMQMMETNAQLVKELATITKDYESRIRQQQTMQTTLRTALDEETSMADICRQSAQRAEAARQAQEEELVAARESCDEYRRQAEVISMKYNAVQMELQELRSQFNSLERQLLELQEHEPELYLLLERGLNEDNNTWLSEVRSKKLELQRQRLEARRLNAELLEHVRDRSSQLRRVQCQLDDASCARQDVTELGMTVRSPPTAVTSAISTPANSEPPKPESKKLSKKKQQR